MDPSSSSQADASSQQGEGSKDDAETKKTNVRKRTKTGCITCRKRRIKCDELHPACRNCIKSKRYCEGYVKKLGWKPPLGQGTYGDDHHGRDPSLQTGLYPNQPRSSPQGPLAFIAPRPMGFGAPGGPTGFMPTTYGPHHPTGGLRTFAAGTQLPMPNPLLAGMSQLPQVVPHSSQQENQFYGAAPPPIHHHQSWAAEDVAPPVPLYSTQQTVAVSWDAEDEDALDSDASMADSDDGLAHSDTVALARAQKRPEIFITGGRLPDIFGPGNSLTHYFVLPHHAIFQNPELQQAFRHFVENTAPVISMYERPPYRCRDTSDKYLLWSFTLPSSAIKHPSLLHAIIALGSLQLANLRGTSTWTAMKQYHLSIRRVAKNVSTPAARTRVSTLAATLLLGYFEVYQSEHASWCNHLFGASILLGEMPIAAMTRRCLAAKRLRSYSYPAETYDSTSPLGQGRPPPRNTDDLDYGLLIYCTGTQVTPEQYGLRHDQPVDDAVLATSDKDIETFETLRDLLWWYNKLDVYQSFLGGSKLLRSYDLWTLCPPRARLGDREAIYGTYDHVILLLGRLANFASKDLIRKRKAARPQPKGDSPQFPGIVPTTQRVTAPRGFGSTKGKGHSEDLNEDATLDISVKDALREWDSIREAFDVMKSYLQTKFKSLSDSYADRRDSPFGTPLQYESYAMAGIWMNYYMGMIQLHRYHPSMPPAAMPAAHQADSATKEYAIMIGRIAAGLTNRSTWEYPRIDVHVAAAFVESAFCLFVAGVQYQDNDQRHWTVRRMHDIVHLVGWKTGVQIANALEAGWTKVAQMGRGPPYTRAQDLGSRMPRPWENPRRVDRFIVKGLGDEARGTLANPGRANLALGLIGIEDDLHALELDE